MFNGVDMYEAGCDYYSGGEPNYKNKDPLYYFVKQPKELTFSNYSEKAYKVVVEYKNIKKEFFMPKSLVKEDQGCYYFHIKFLKEKMKEV